MERIGQGIGTIGLCCMIVGVAHFAPDHVVAACVASIIIGIFMWGA